MIKYRLHTPTGFQECPTRDAAVIAAALLEIQDPVIDEIEYTLAVPDPLATIMKSIAGARVFGSDLLNKWSAKFMLIGSRTENMTHAIRIALLDTASCLILGSLYEAIDAAKRIPPELKDPKYINDANLLAFVNEIETYLGLPLSVSL